MIKAQEKLAQRGEQSELKWLGLLGTRLVETKERLHSRTQIYCLYLFMCVLQTGFFQQCRVEDELLLVADQHHS